ANAAHKFRLITRSTLRRERLQTAFGGTMTYNRTLATFLAFPRNAVRESALLVVFGLVAAPFFTTVLAQGLTRMPTNNPPFTVAAGLACAFPLQGEPVINQEVTKKFPPDPNGDVKQIITGRLVFE